MKKILSIALSLVFIFGAMAQVPFEIYAAENQQVSETLDNSEAKGFTITAQPTNTTATLNENATFDVSANGEGMKYRWYYKDANGSAFTQSSIKTKTYTISATAARNGRQVYCVVTDKNGNSITSDIATLTVLPKVQLEILSQPAFDLVEFGETIQVTMSVQGDGLSYVWYCRNAGSTSWYKSSIRTATYSVVLNKSSIGREIYCVVTDALGNQVTTESIVLNTNPEKTLAILSQPAYETIKLDQTVNVTMKVQGDGLSYAWYCRNAGTANWYKSSITASSYSVKLTTKVLGREVYCVIKDALGNTVTTDVVTLNAIPNNDLQIISQPDYQTATIGETINVTMDVQGDYLTYTWYCRNAGSSSWYKSSIKAASYSVSFTKAVLGREIYCVITDAFGNTVTTDVVTLLEKSEESNIEIVRDIPLVDSVKEILPSTSIATAATVGLSSSPYALTDTSRFAGKKITKIGIPVQTVDLSNGKPIFTLSVVKTDVNTNAYSYVAQYKLELNVTNTTVNNWVYVDLNHLNIQLAENETLAFGAPTDTVLWAYISGTINNRYTFRSTASNWTAINANSILFDVYTNETLVFNSINGVPSATIEVPVQEDIKEILPQGGINGAKSASLTNAPFFYSNSYSIYQGKTITKIGIPVKTVSKLDDNQTFTLSVLCYENGKHTIVRSYQLKLPKAQLGAKTTVNRWIYMDLTALNITIGENETLGFGAPTDTVKWGYKGTYTDKRFFFNSMIQEHLNTGIFFDVYCQETITHEQYQAEQKKAENELALQQLLSGKTISILGDSISTFTGYSNNTSYNSTIGNNALYYKDAEPFKSVYETWWMQTINRTGLSLNVNNSYSGDKITEKGLSRALQLHNNNNVSPDIIAVYLGINDFRTGVTLDAFVTAYTEMIRGMQEKYSDADIFLFTMAYTTRTNNGIKPESITQYNAAIKAIATELGCTVVDIAGEHGINQTNYSTYMCDGDLHPNYLGMDLMTERFVEAITEKYVK